VSAIARPLERGDIVDIRWGDQRDRAWLRKCAPRDFYLSAVRELPQWFRREMSVYRCAECGEFGALEGIGEQVLQLWTIKRRRCADCVTGARE
jgi:hypothetical protein